MRPILLWSLLLLVSWQHAYGYSGDDILNDCRKPGFEGGYCRGYVVATAESYDLGRQNGAVYAHLGFRIPTADEARDDPVLRTISARARAYCAPAAVTGARLVDVVTRYILAHPGDKQRDAQLLVVLAMVDAFPCKD